MAVDAQRAYRDALPAGELIEFSTTALDQAGVPSHSVTLIDAAGPWYGGLGFGLTPERAALGAVGEMVEGVGARLGRERLPRRTATFTELSGEQAVDPVLLGLPAGSSYTPDLPLQWVPLRRLGDDAQRWVPAEFVASTPSDLQDGAGAPTRLITPVTNGLGAGTTRDMAVLHGLLEVLQRDGNGLSIRAADTGVGLRLDVPVSPTSQDVLDRLRSAGISVQVKLASTDFGVSTVVVTGMAPGDDLVVATSMGEGTSPDPQKALEKALLEFAGARPRKRLMFGPLPPVEAIAPPGYLPRMLGRIDLATEEEPALRAMTTWVADPPDGWPKLLQDTIFRVDREVAFSQLPTAPADDPGQVLAMLRERLAAEGFDILVAHLLDAGDVHVARVVVPGLEVETLSYLRLGARNAARLLARQEAGTLPVIVRRGPQRPGDRAVALTAAAQKQFGGPLWLHPAAVAGLVGELYPLYREPNRHAVQLALGRVQG